MLAFNAFFLHLGTTATLVATEGFHGISLTNPLYMELIDKYGNVLTQTQLDECSGTFYGLMNIQPGLVKHQLRGHDCYSHPFAIPVSPLMQFAHPHVHVSIVGLPDGIANPGRVVLSITNNNDEPNILAVRIEFSSTSGVQFEYVPGDLNLVLQPKESTEVSVNLSVPLDRSELKFNWRVNVTEGCTNTTSTFPFQVYATPAYEVQAKLRWIPDSRSNGKLTYSLSANFGNELMDMALASGQHDHDHNVKIKVAPNVNIQISMSAIDAVENGVTIEMKPLQQLKEITGSSMPC